MLSVDEFANILNKPESTILDFKADMYDFSDDQDLKTTSKFVKDVISFCNTVRSENSYIIFGVQEDKNGVKKISGLLNNIDDSILQQKIKNKVNPTPSFHYYTINYKDNNFGVLEFPVFKYSMPLSSTVNLKGIEFGKVYHRLGTSNNEALVFEIIRINEWLQGLPEFSHADSMDSEINKLIKDLTEAKVKLSTIISKMHEVAKKYKLEKLKSFASTELAGFGRNTEINEDELNYRKQRVFISVQRIDAVNASSTEIKRELERNDDFKEYKLMFSQSIIVIEEYIAKFEAKSNGLFGTIKMNSKDFFPDNAESDYTIFAYFFYETVINLYSNIRQNAINLLIKIN